MEIGVYGMIAIASVAGAVFLGILIVAMLLKDLQKMRLEHSSGSKEVLECIEALAGKFESFERRMANLESIVIEREKEHTFRDALDEQ